MPPLEVRQLGDTLQQKFLEKRRLEGLSLPAHIPAEDVRNPESKATQEAMTNAADTPNAKKSKAKATAERKAALKLKRKAKGQVKKAAAKAQEAPIAGKLEKETTSSKKKANMAKKEEKLREEERLIKEERPSTATSIKVLKTRRTSGKTSATKKLSGSKLVERLKSDITELEKALELRTKNERKLILQRALSEASKVPEVYIAQSTKEFKSNIYDLQPSTVPKTPRPSPPIHRAAPVRLRKIKSDAQEKLLTLKESSRRGTSKSRIRRTLAAPGKAPKPTKLTTPFRNQSLKAALGVEDQEYAKEAGKAAIEKIKAEDLKLQRECSRFGNYCKTLTVAST